MVEMTGLEGHEPPPHRIAILQQRWTSMREESTALIDIRYKILSFCFLAVAAINTIAVNSQSVLLAVFAAILPGLGIMMTLRESRLIDEMGRALAAIEREIDDFYELPEPLRGWDRQYVPGVRRFASRGILLSLIALVVMSCANAIYLGVRES